MVNATARLGALKARDVMTNDVLVLAPDTPLHDAVRTFAEAHISGAPVVDTNGRLLGVLSTNDVAAQELDDAASDARRNELQDSRSLDRDEDDFEEDEAEILSMNAYSSGVLRTGLVTDFMSSGAVTVAPNASLKQVCERMVSERIHRVLVVENKELVGIVSSFDVVRALAKHG